MLLSVIVPAYNERHTLGTILVAVARALPNVGKEIIVVDDCSHDGTREWLKANFSEGPRRGSVIELDGEGNLVFRGDQTLLTIRPVYHERNRGKGAGTDRFCDMHRRGRGDPGRRSRIRSERLGT